MSEHTHQQLREPDVDSNAARNGATTVAMCFIALPMWMVFSGWVVVLGMRAGPLNLVGTAVVVLFGGFGIAYLAALAAVPIGWFAHRWFWQSPIPVNRMAAAMALILDVTVSGWILVIVLNSNP